MIGGARLEGLVALVFVLGGPACSEEGAETAGPPTVLALSASPDRIRPDGMISTVQVSALDADGRFTNGDVLLRATCGTLSGADATAGRTVALHGGMGSAAYSCNPAATSCCTDGLEVTVTATMGALVTTRTVALDASATGGGGGSSGGGGGSSGGGGGSSGGGGGDDDTFAFDVAPFSPGEVAAYDGFGVAHLSAMDEPMIGFGSSAISPWIGAAGEILYLDGSSSPQVLREMVPDHYTRLDGAWTHPSAPGANDREVPTPACADGAVDFVPKQGGGDVLYRCSFQLGEGGWFDQAGELRVEEGFEPLSWNANGTILVTGGDTLSLIDPGGSPVLVSTPLAPSGTRPRATASGFWFVGGAPNQLGFISENGTVIALGTVADAPAGYTLHDSGGVLDENGDAYAIAERIEGGVRVASAVIRRPLVPGESTVVHEEPADAPGWDGTTTPPTTSVKITPAIHHLTTGP